MTPEDMRRVVSTLGYLSCGSHLWNDKGHAKKAVRDFCCGTKANPQHVEQVLALLMPLIKKDKPHA